MSHRFDMLVTSTCYSSKPSGNQAGSVRKNLHAAAFDEDAFANAMACGRAWLPAVVYGRQVKANWNSQQLIGLDFDGKRDYLDPSEAVERLNVNGITPSCLYFTYSSTSDHLRYRIVIVLDEPCRDSAVMSDAIARLLYLFPESDPACSDLVRMFYGAKDSDSVVRLHKSEDYRRCPMSTVLSLPAPPAPERISDRPKRRPSSSNARRFPRMRIDDIKQSFDLLSLVRSDTGENGTDCGGYVRFHRCPVCGHRDCFSYYPETNSWACFSTSNSTGFKGGDPIDYAMAHGGLSFPEALEYLDSLS